MTTSETATSEVPNLPPGWSIRPSVEADLPAVEALIRALEEHLVGSSEADADEIREHWQGLDPGRDTWVVLTSEDELAGFADYTHRGAHVRLQGDGYVHPRWLGRDVGAALVRSVEARAGEDVALAPPGARVVLQFGIMDVDTCAHGLFRGAGYVAVRHFRRMELSLAETPPAPVWPDGITVRPAAGEADERRLFAATDEAFRDHWGYAEQTFEEWAARKRTGGVDPSLWLLAEEGDEVAGTLVCGRVGGSAVVKDLAVRRPWRRRGLGRALLLHVAGELHRRGEPAVALGVDAANPTGAAALYESVGMRTTEAYAVYERQLRAGADLGDPET